MDTQQQAERLRALWKSGRDKYRSFFAVLNEIRQEIGDDALPMWCRNELAIGLSVITNMAATLNKADEEAVKANLAAANKHEQEKRAAERKAREEESRKRDLEKAEAARKRQLERAEHDRQLAAINNQTARLKAENNKTEDREKAREQKRKEDNERYPSVTARRERQRLTTRISDVEFAELVKRFKRADELCTTGIDRWIEGSIAKAIILCAMRKAYPADQGFGERLDAEDIKLGKDDRAALIGLGQLGETRLREILTSTDSRSYQLIWRENRPLKAVENLNTAVS